ncbi:MAG: histidine kinase dimerization/phospho-acceptor domain-containing protein [Gemmatimonadales bacterium]
MTHPAPDDPRGGELTRLKHDLANPLAALLAEVQLLLLDSEHLPAPARTALKSIESLAIKMRTIIRS